MKNAQIEIKPNSIQKMNENEIIKLVFPNFSVQPVVQRYRKSTLSKIPYFDKLLNGSFSEAEETTFYMEENPILFSKLVRESVSENDEENDEDELNRMADFFGVERKPKNPSLYFSYETIDLSEKFELPSFVDFSKYGIVHKIRIGHCSGQHNVFILNVNYCQQLVPLSAIIDDEQNICPEIISMINECGFIQLFCTQNECLRILIYHEKGPKEKSNFCQTTQNKDI